MMDIDWEKNRQTCQTPGCDWPSWHVCLVGKEDKIPALLRAEKRTPRSSQGPRDQDWKDSMAEAQRKRWAAIHASQKPRDDAMVARYNETEIGMRELAEMFEVSRNVALRVLHEAEKEGRVVIRPQGVTVRSRR